MNYIRIIIFSVGCSVIYGILQDEVTAHVCVEYFTIGHAKVFPTSDPTLIAIGWGIIATWWVGLPLGLLLALASRAGPRPKLTIRVLRLPVFILMLCTGVASLITGLAGYVVARTGGAQLLEPLASRVPQAKHALFIADWWAHENAYCFGTIGGVAVCIWAWHTRERLRRVLPPRSNAGDVNYVCAMDKWRAVLRRVGEWAWDDTQRINTFTRIVAILALIVLALGSVNLIRAWVTAAGDVEGDFLIALFDWPIPLFVVWFLSTIGVLAARQPKAALLLISAYIAVSVLGVAFLVAIAGSAGVTVAESLILFNALAIYFARRLMLRAKTSTSKV